MGNEGYEAAVNTFAKRAAKANPPKPEDYIGDDGLLYCGKCHTPKQAKKKFIDKTRIVTCTCQCAEIRRRKRMAEESAKHLRERGGISRTRRFEKATMTPEMEKCRDYVKNWEKAQKKNIGLLFWGGFGAGKTFAAHCICNALIERDEPVSVYATSIAKILNSGYDKSEVLERIRSVPLLVLDDLGAERGSEYAIENVFVIVDERYRAKKPMIVTTNLTMEELKNPVTRDERTGRPDPDIRRKRIYDRVLEMCVPIYFHGESRRMGIAAEKKTDLGKLFES